MNFNKIIIWGHKLHSHTHSYIHQAFNIAFTHLKYNVLWLDDNDDIRLIQMYFPNKKSEEEYVKELESAFSIDAVSKQLYSEYRDLYERLDKELNEIYTFGNGIGFFYVFI